MSLDEISTLPVLSDKTSSQSSNPHDRFLWIQRVYWSRVFHIEEQTPEAVFSQMKALIETANSNGLRVNHMWVLQNMLDAGCDPEKSGELIQGYIRIHAAFVFRRAESMIERILFQEEDPLEFFKLIAEAKKLWYDPYKCQEVFGRYMENLSIMRYEKAEDAVFAPLKYGGTITDCKKLIQEAFEAWSKANDCEQLFDIHNRTLYWELKKTLKISMIYWRKLPDYRERINEVRTAWYSTTACNILEKAYEKYFSKIA